MTRPFVRMWPPLLASSCPLRHECKSYSRENMITRTYTVHMHADQTAGMARVQAIHTCMQTIVRSPATYHMHVHVRNVTRSIYHACIHRSWLSFVSACYCSSVMHIIIMLARYLICIVYVCAPALQS